MDVESTNKLIGKNKKDLSTFTCSELIIIYFFSFTALMAIFQIAIFVVNVVLSFALFVATVKVQYLNINIKFCL